MDQSSKDILLRYALPCPRYTSYPAASAFLDSFGPEDGIRDLRIASLGAEPVWLYVRLPSCRPRPAAGGRAAAPSARKPLVRTYLQGLEVELALVAEALDERRRIGRLHLEGDIGVLDEEDLRRLWGALQAHFQIEPACELALELGSGAAPRLPLALLCSFGFSRLRLEVEAHGLASASRTGALPEMAAHCRALGFESIDVDMLYALPGQSLETLDSTLSEVLSARPDRIALQNLASLPARFASLRGWDAAGIPAAPARLELQLLAHGRLLERGYRPVGFDHFALPEDRLCQGLDRKQLHRGFMGYCIGPSPDLIGLGTGAVGEVQGAYRQNAPELGRYLTALSRGQLPVVRGYRKDAEDELRGEIIQRLLCLMEVDLEAVVREHGFRAGDFGRELGQLRRLAEDGLVEVEGPRVRLTELGRLAAGAVAQLFDRHDRGSTVRGASLPA